MTLRALDQNIDTSDETPLSRAMVKLLGMFAELERNFIVTRTKEGREVTGLLGGRPAKLTEQQQAEIARLYHQGISKRVLATGFGVSRQTILRILKMKRNKL
ncbi:MAG: helix-turn-helix domain-containing protein [Porticoccaceae bacterium]